MARTPLISREELAGGIPRYRPAASPTATHQRTNAGAKLHQLAESLSSLAPTLGRIGQLATQRQAEQDTMAGEQWAAEQAASQELWAGAIKDGKIAPHQSPWFRIAAAKKLGQVAGDKFGATLTEKLAELGDGATLDDFEEAASEARAEYLKANGASGDRHFMDGFLATGDGAITNARRQFAAQAGQRLEQNATAAFAQRQNQIVEDGLDKGLSIDTIAAQLNEETAAWAGVNPEAKRQRTLGEQSLNQINANAILQAARRTRNMDLVEQLAAKVKAGTGTLQHTAWINDALDETQDYITAAIEKRDTQERAERERVVAEAAESVTETLVTTFRAGGTLDRSAAIAQLSEAGDRSPETTYEQLVAKLPELVPTTFIEMRGRKTPPSRSVLMDAARSNRITVSQYNTLVSELEAAERAAEALARSQQETPPTLAELWNHPSMRLAEQTVDAMADARAPKSVLTGIREQADFSELDVQQAQADARMNLLRFMSVNPNASAEDVMLQADMFARSAALVRGIVNQEEAQVRSNRIGPRDDEGKATTRSANTTSQTRSPAQPAATPRRATYTKRDIVALANALDAGRLTPEQANLWRSLGGTNPDDAPEIIARALQDARP